MLTEIEIEDVGIYRLPNMWQWKRICRVRGPNRCIAPLAVGLGLTYKEFRKLPLEKQKDAQRAYLDLTSPANIDPLPRTGPPPRTVAFWPRIHRTEEEKIEIGRQLLQIKKSLPRGHFGLWLKSEAGISGKTAQQCMRLAKESA